MTDRRAEPGQIERSLRDAISLQRGHFVYESGHHGDLWLELDGLFQDARRLRRWAGALAVQAAPCQADFICGPLTGGAFVAQFLADETGAGFAYADRLVDVAGTLADLRDCGASLSGLASLLALGDSATRLSARTGAPFFALLTIERGLWPPAQCPLCAEGLPLDNPLA